MPKLKIVRQNTAPPNSCDPAEFLPDADPAPLCVLGHPPRAFHPVHRPRFVIRRLQRIRACLADPVETEWVDG